MSFSNTLRFFYAIDTHAPHADEVYRVFEEFCSLYGFSVYRQDLHGLIGDIARQIFDEIDRCDYFVADVTTRNPNVMIELGYAFHALGRDRVIVFHGDQQAERPFDILTQHTVFYSLAKTFDEASTELELVKKKLLRFFHDPTHRVGFDVKRYADEIKTGNVEILFHFPETLPRLDWQSQPGGIANPGGQRFNELGNIVISHDEPETRGNWENDNLPEGCNSYMILVNKDRTRDTVRYGDILHIRIRALLKRGETCKFTCTCDIGEKEVANGQHAFVWAHGWTQHVVFAQDNTGTPTFQIVGEGQFDIPIEPYYLEGWPERRGERRSADHSLLQQVGFNVGLGSTIKPGTIEISEVLVFRERAT